MCILRFFLDRFNGVLVVLMFGFVIVMFICLRVGVLFWIVLNWIVGGFVLIDGVVLIL